LEIKLIAVDRIVEDPDQPRKHQDEEGLSGLADSIRQHGILNPISVTHLPNLGVYRIVTGERRWRAAQKVGLRDVPCVVKEIEPDEVLTEQLIENVQREDLQPAEKARALMHIKDALGATNREIGARLGLSERAVGYLLDLLELPPAISESVISSPNRPADGQLTEKHARFLKQLNDLPDLQTAVVEKIREERLNSDHTGNLVKALRKKPEAADEILRSPADHLIKFFRDGDSGVALAEPPVMTQTRPSAYAARIIDMVEALGQIQPSELPRPEVHQVQDSLTSLKLAVDGLLRECKLELEGT
jgi:ParB family chromosome partitioning protein